MKNIRNFLSMLLEPHFPEAFYGYGKLLISQDETEKGMEIMRQALDKPFTFLSVLTREEVERELEIFRENLEKR